jgi:hypothetical protein
MPTIHRDRVPPAGSALEQRAGASVHERALRAGAGVGPSAGSRQAARCPRILRCAGALVGLAACIGLLQPAPAPANSSSATLAAGGLQLSRSPDISMESEDLHISRTQVRVAYRFRNTSGRDISTLVAFPMPDLMQGEDRNYDLEGRDPVNFMDFQVTVDGRRVEPSVELRATRFGVDVTAVLRRHGIPPILSTASDDVSLKLSAEATGSRRSPPGRPSR